MFKSFPWKRVIIGTIAIAATGFIKRQLEDAWDDYENEVYTKNKGTIQRNDQSN